MSQVKPHNARMFIAALTFAAFCCAALSGLAGLGGGTVLIGLLYAIGLPHEQAVPLFAAIQFVSNSTRTVAYAGHVEWSAAGWFLLALLPATLLLAPLVEGVNTNMVQLLLGVLILVSLWPTRSEGSPLPTVPSFIAAGAVNGALGLFVGATGLLVGRLFLRPEWSKETTVGTLAMTQMFGHGLRVAAYGWIGYSAFAQLPLLLPLCAAVVAGTWAGKAINHRVSQAAFQRLFNVLLALFSAKLIWDGAQGLLSA